MKRLSIYLLFLVILLPQLVHSQTYGTGPYGSGPYGGGESADTNQRADNNPRMPFLIGLKVSYDGNPLNSSLVQVKNLNTNEFESDYTNEHGVVVFNLVNFETRYLQGDLVEITVCLSDDRCKETSRNYSVIDSGGLIIDFKLSSEQEEPNKVSSKTEEKNQIIQELPQNENVTVIYIDNSSHITNYINNSTQTTKYLNQSSATNININNEASDTNIIINVTVTLFGITVISVVIWKIFIYFRKSRKNKRQK